MSRWFIAAFAALSLAMLLVTFVWLDTLNKPVVAKTPQPAPSLAKVLVANQKLSSGAFIEQTSLAWKEVTDLERKDLGSVYLQGIYTLEQIAGSIAINSIAENTVLTADMILTPKDSGFISALVQPGKRAITLRLDPESAGLGMVNPGNRVDILMSGESEIENAEDGTPIYDNMSVKTVLQNINLLAIDGRFSPYQEKVERKYTHFDPVPVTFEVAPEQAEQLVLASKIGDLSLVLRGFDDEVIIEHQPYKFAKDISEAYEVDNQPKAVKVIRGDENDD